LCMDGAVTASATRVFTSVSSRVWVNTGASLTGTDGGSVGSSSVVAPFRSWQGP
jgi:hypothetical protein